MHHLLEVAFEIHFVFPKGQLILKANCQAVNSSKEGTKEDVFTTTLRH